MDFAGKRGLFFLVSLLAILPGVAFFIFAPGLKPGIDFSGGSTLSLKFSETVQQEDLRLELADLGHPDAIVQNLGDNTYFVRTKELGTEEKQTIVGALESALAPNVQEVGITGPDGRIAFTVPRGATKLRIIAASSELPGELELEFPESGEPVTGSSPGSPTELGLQLEGEAVPGQEVSLLVTLQGFGMPDALVKLNGMTIPSFDRVSPVVARETVRNAFFAVLLAAVGIFFYVWFAFRNVPSPFRYGAAAIVALVHDAALVIGIFATLGVLIDMEVNTMFLIALLTVIGYSVNDTIVIFDRVRENTLLYPNRTLSETVNVSISESLARSLNTSLTLLFVLLAMFLFGGPTIRSFLLVLIIGVVAGTYSSIGVASQLLVSWDQGDFGRLFRRIRSPLPSRAQ